uniref:Uncharacterized protein n=1 Tax=Anguilla anguilla TaxID=7936 RepID=A0A0E9U8I3_ANGAN
MKTIPDQGVSRDFCSCSVCMENEKSNGLHLNVQIVR